jgi:hypothetical protein
MQITLDLPDDVCAKAEAIAKQQSRSVGSLFVELVRKLKAPEPPPASGRGEWKLPVVKGRPVTEVETNADLCFTPGQRFPVSPGRPITEAELEQILEEDSRS